MRKLYVVRCLLLVILMGGVMGKGLGQVSITVGGTIAQDFTIGTSGTATLPAGWKTDKNTSVRTVGSYSSAASATDQAGAASISTTASAGIYNFGSSTTSTDRAVGGLSSSSAAKSVNVYLDLLNNASTTISSYNISYNVEKYRNGSNSAGYTIQMYYSTDGTSWTSAGSIFTSNFSADANNSGSSTTPISTIAIASKTLIVATSGNSHLYLAWNYSVTTGTTTSNAQGLGIDDVSITAASNSITLSPSFQSFGPFCNNTSNNVALTYIILGTVTSPFIQLSNSSGSFVSGTTNLGGVITGSSPYTITASIPALQAQGNYKIRVASTDATTVISSDNGSNIIISSVPVVGATAGGAASVCVGAVTPAFTNSTNGGAWSVTNGTGSASITAGGVVTGITAGTATINYTVINGACTNMVTTPLTVNSLPIDPTGTITPVANPTCTSTTLHYSNAGATYFWQTTASGTDISSPTTSDLTITTSGIYYVRQYNGSCWSASSLASPAITINTTPAIAVNGDPENASVELPNPTSFSVTTTGTVNTYQWQVSDDGGASWANIIGSSIYSGEATSTLTIGNSTDLTGNQYKCIVTGPCGTVTSGSATLTAYTTAYIWTNPITGTDPYTANPYTTNQLVKPNLTVSGISRGTGIVGNTSNNRYNANSWNVSSIDLNKFFSFTLSPASSYKIDFTSFVYSSQSSNTGPTAFAIRSSLDNYASNIATPPATGGTFSLSGAAFQNITLPITFHVYGWAASAQPGTFSINDFTFNGAVSSTCALPATPIANANTTPQTTSISPSCFSANWNVVSPITEYRFDASPYPTFATATSLATDLFISEYVEGSSSNKYIEIYNGTGVVQNLSDYKLRLFSNGVSTASQDVSLSGTLNIGSVIVYKNSTATVYPGVSAANLAVNFNGNDAIALYKISTAGYVDIFGRIGENPGTAWTSGSLTTAGKTLVRKPNITTGVTSNPSAGFPALATQWDQYDVDDVSHLGSHTFTGTSAPAFVTGYNNLLVSSDSIKQAVTGLVNNTTYYYRIRSVNACGNSLNSNVVTVITTDQTTSGYRSKKTGNYSDPTAWEYDPGCGAAWVQATVAPGLGNNVTIQSPHTVTLDANASIGTTKTLTVNSGATLDLTDKVLNGAGAFTLSSGGKLSIGSTAGISLSGATGNVQVSGTRSYSKTADYNYAGTSAQITGNGLPDTVNALSIAATVLMSQSATVTNSLNVASGTLAINGNTLTANGNISGAGTLTGSLLSNLIVNGTGTLNFTPIFPSNLLNNLTTNSTGTVSLGSDLNIAGIFTPTAGVFNLNDRIVTLKAGTKGESIYPFTKVYPNTAIVGQVGATIIYGSSGAFIVERYIPGKRSFRFITPEVNTTGTARDNWQEAGSLTGGYGTFITGGTTSNGFDQSATNNPSLFIWDISTQGYKPVNNTNTGVLNAGNAWRLFVRGDRTININDPTNNPAATSTILRTKGKLFTGTATLNSGSSSTPSTLPQLSILDTGYTFIGNPYASPIDWNNMINVNLATQKSTFPAVNISPTYHTWDPNFNMRGIYVAYNAINGTAPTVSAVSRVLQPGQAIFIQNDGSNSSLQFQEVFKTTTGFSTVFRTSSDTTRMVVNLLLNNNGGPQDFADGVLQVFNDSFPKAIGNEDSRKFANQDENLAINENGTLLSIEGRPRVSLNDTVFLNMWQFRQKTYYLQTDAQNFAPGIDAFLKDSYLNTESPISLSDTTLLPFSLTADSASFAPDRFMIIFRPSSSLPVTVTNLKGYQKNKGVQLDWISRNEINIKKYEIEKSYNGQQFEIAGSVTAIGNNSLVENYSWFDANPHPGNNFYRIKIIDKSGAISYTSVVKVAIEKDQSFVSVYPNPVKGNVLGVQFSNMEAGRYTLTLYNNMGQQVYESSINHSGGSVNYPVKTGLRLAKGSYRMNVKNGDFTINATLIFE